MKILLQSKRTKDYVKGDGNWTPRAEQAREFDTGLEAIFYCFNHPCPDMQISGEFGDARMNFTMAVSDRRSSPLV